MKHLISFLIVTPTYTRAYSIDSIVYLQLKLVQYVSHYPTPISEGTPWTSPSFALNLLSCIFYLHIPSFSVFILHKHWPTFQQKYGSHLISSTFVTSTKTKRPPGTSLVVQWLGICLPVQGTRVQSQVREVPHTMRQPWLCTTTTEARTLEPEFFNKRRHCCEKPVHHS